MKWITSAMIFGEHGELASKEPSGVLIQQLN